MGSEIPRPIDAIRYLAANGLSLRMAHKALGRVSEGDTVAVELRAASDAVVRELGDLGILARPISVPAPNIRKIREKLGLSQEEFATRFGLEADTIRNWEQRRNIPDPATRIVLALIESNPAAVEAVLQGHPGPPGKPQ